MPVLTWSEKTSPQDGFSRKRVMRPSAPHMTTPYSSGASTEVRAMVTAAPRFRWKSTRAPRSMFVSTSPLMTRKVSPSSGSMFLTLPAVPRGTSSTKNLRFTPSHDPSGKWSRTASGRWCRVSRASLKPWRPSRPRTCSRMGLFPTGTIGFGTLHVRGRSLVPSPPAMTTAFTGLHPSGSEIGTDRPRARPHPEPGGGASRPSGRCR